MSRCDPPTMSFCSWENIDISRALDTFFELCHNDTQIVATSEIPIDLLRYMKEKHRFLDTRYYGRCWCEDRYSGKRRVIMNQCHLNFKKPFYFLVLNGEEVYLCKHFYF